MRRLAAPLVLVVSMASAAGPAAPPQGAAPVPVTVAPERVALAVGERAILSYRAELPQGASLAVETLFAPRPEGPAGEAGPLAEPEIPAPPRLEKDKATGRTIWTLAVPVMAFASGEVVIPGPVLALTREAGEKTVFQAPSATLVVASRLPAGAKEGTLEPKPDRPARIPRHGAWFWGLWAGGLGLVAALGWLLWRRARKPAPAGTPEIAPLDPAVELAAVLERLTSRVESLEEDSRGFYSELTHAAKRYLERRTDLPVLEWTTFETLRRLRSAGHELPREVGLSELLGSADRVKFGRAASTREEARGQVGRARLLLEHVESEHRRRLAESEARIRAQGTGGQR